MSGFTMMEVIVAISLITVVAAALTPFLVRSIQVLRLQVDRQTATQLAADAWEQVNAVQTPPGQSPTLPAPVTRTVNGVAYTVTWQEAKCVRKAAATDTPCGPWSDHDTLTDGDVTYYRVLITVRWKGNTCPDGSCSYQTSALMNTDDDPSFELR